MNTNQSLATEKIGKLMLKFSIPCIMSLLVSSLYNIVDQIFIGRGVGNAVVLAAGLGIILMILFFAGRETILRIFGATENKIIPL